MGTQRGRGTMGEALTSPADTLPFLVDVLTNTGNALTDAADVSTNVVDLCDRYFDQDALTVRHFDQSPLPVYTHKGMVFLPCEVISQSNEAL